MLTESLLLEIEPGLLDEKKLHRLKLALSSSPGNSRIYFKLKLNGSGDIQMVSNRQRIKLTYATLGQINEIIGLDHIQVKVNEA